MSRHLKISNLLALVWGIALFSVIFAVPYQATVKSHSGRDYASYYYAIQASGEEQSPYDIDALNQLAQEEGTRKSVHPFFYPPPATLFVSWLAPFSLKSGYVAFFWFNQFCLLGTLMILHRWRNVAWSTLFACSLLLWPVLDTMKMGQINLFVGLMMLVAIRYRSGLALSVAAMTKMSPALIFFGWISERAYKPAVICSIGCVCLSVLSLPWVSFSEQIRFYTEVLPQFASGAYHGLKIPINIPANHSIPDLYNQLFPGESSTILSATAKTLSSITSGVLLLTLLFWIRTLQDSESKLFASVALIPLMLLIPVYCYEHHLALLLVPIVLVFESIPKHSVSNRFVFWLVVLWGGQPLFSLRWLQRTIGVGEWWFQESKFLFVLCIGLYCLWHSYKLEQKSLIASS